MNKLILSIAIVLCSVCTACSTITDSGNGAVTDSVNKLVIQRCPIGQSWDGNKCNGNSRYMNWWDAMKAAKDSRELGQDDWRLPSEEEVNASMKKRALCVDADHERVSEYWTSTKSSKDGETGRLIGRNDCNENYWWQLLQNESTHYEVRLVRAGKANAQAEFNHEYEISIQNKISFKALEEKKEIEEFLELTNQTSLGKKRIAFSYVRSEENDEAVLDIKYNGNAISEVTLYVPNGYMPCNPNLRCRVTNSFMRLKGTGTGAYTALPFQLLTPDRPSNVMAIKGVDIFSGFWRRSDTFILKFYNEYGDPFNATFYKGKMINKYEDSISVPNENGAKKAIKR